MPLLTAEAQCAPADDPARLARAFCSMLSSGTALQLRLALMQICLLCHCAIDSSHWLELLCVDQLPASSQVSTSMLFLHQSQRNERDGLDTHCAQAKLDATRTAENALSPVIGVQLMRNSDTCSGNISVGCLLLYTYVMVSSAAFSAASFHSDR